ncbi:hypothetical protein RSAG8_06381, partial [Rhizoctonia solani AG-8 WAC10335]
MLPSNELYRCTTCLGAGIFCSECMKSLHRFTPTHRLKRWDGSSWVSTDLVELGYTLCLGPHNGKPCSPGKEPSKLLVGDLNGFTHTRVHYCNCNGALTRPRQLLSIGLFPCSHTYPESALTLQLLDIHNMFMSVGRTSAHKHYTVLERYTKPGFRNEVDDRYRELMWTHRRHSHLLNLRRSGYKFPLHPDIDVHPGDQAFDCVACPRPGFNFEWFEVEPDEVVWFRAWFSYDGNFRMVRKSKKVATGDICLSDGCGYVPAKQGYKLWTETVQEPKRTPTCDHHKAGNDTSGRWVGHEITGVGALSCTRHTCIAPRGMVDFWKGERFIYADYALACLLSYLNKRRGGCLPIGLTYDVACHWITNFFARAELLPETITIPPNLDLIVAIPKWHLIGHERDCYIRWSLDHTQYVGRMEGEGPERFWAMFNQHSGSTSEQGPGVRTENFNNIIRAWNEGKAFTMDETLPAQYEDAKKALVKQTEIHDDLTAELPLSTIKEWEEESIEPVKDAKGNWTSPMMDPVFTGAKGNWTSPMMDPVFTGGFYNTVRDERKKESSTDQGPGRRSGVVRWLSTAIELEHSIKNYNDEAEEKAESSERLSTRRISLGDRIRAHQRKRESFMEGAPECDSTQVLTLYDEDEDEDDIVDLAMPSSYKPETISSAGLSSIAEVEKGLRRGMCKESLQVIKQLLASRSAAYKAKDRNARGQVATTRARASIRDQDEKIQKACWRYNNSLRALKQLGLSEDDAKTFKPLSDSDLTPLKTYFDNYATQPGQKGTMSWIWRSSAAPNSANWEVQALKTEWFRSREHYKRRREHLVLLKREMVMTIRSFLRYEELWTWKASSNSISLGMKAYAHGRAKFFRSLAYKTLVACRKALYVSHSS